jgi:hypothetical protein
MVLNAGAGLLTGWRLIVLCRTVHESRFRRLQYLKRAMDA